MEVTCITYTRVHMRVEYNIQQAELSKLPQVRAVGFWREIDWFTCEISEKQLSMRRKQLSMQRRQLSMLRKPLSIRRNSLIYRENRSVYGEKQLSIIMEKTENICVRSINLGGEQC